MAAEKLELPREATLYRLCDIYGVSVKGKFLDEYNPDDSEQRTMVLKALKGVFRIDFNGRYIAMDQIAKMVEGFNRMLFIEPHNRSLDDNSKETLTTLTTGAIQENLAGNPQAQFQLVKDLRDAAVRGSGNGQYFDFSGAGKAVLDVIIDAFGWQEFASQNPDGLKLAYSGMTHRLQTLAQTV